MTDTGWRGEVQEWRRGLLTIRLPLAGAQSLLALILLASSGIELTFVLVLTAWWTGPSIIYLVAIRTRVASCVCGPAIVILTGWLLVGEIPLLREWDKLDRPTLGFLGFPGGSIVYPFLLTLLVIGTIAVEVVSLANIRRSADRRHENGVRSP